MMRSFLILIMMISTAGLAQAYTHLENVKYHFDKYVDQDTYSDFEFSAELITYEDWFEISDHIGDSLQSVGIIDFKYSQIEENVVETVIEKLQFGYAPFFCAQYKDLQDDDMWSDRFEKKCLSHTKKLLEHVSKGAAISVLEVDGDYYGDYRFVELFAVDDKNKQVLKITFDILHEI